MNILIYIGIDVIILITGFILGNIYYKKIKAKYLVGSIIYWIYLRVSKECAKEIFELLDKNDFKWERK